MAAGFPFDTEVTEAPAVAAASCCFCKAAYKLKRTLWTMKDVGCIVRQLQNSMCGKYHQIPCHIKLSEEVKLTSVGSERDGMLAQLPCMSLKTARVLKPL